MVPSLVVVIERRGGGGGVVGVEQWAELRREHFVGGKSIKELARRDGVVAQHGPSGAAQRAAAGLSSGRRGGSMLDPFKEEIHRLLQRGSEAAGGPGPRAA